MIGIIIQARMGSSRLPGKILMDILPNQPMLDLIIGRLHKSKLVDMIIIATSTSPADDILAERFKTESEIKLYRGSETDVLSRYYECAKLYQLDTIIRVTADCPAIDPMIIDQLIVFYLKGGYDYASNVMERTYPRGFDAEIFSFKTLEWTFFNAVEPLEREHVTIGIYNRDKWKLGNMSSGHPEYAKYRLTVDTQADLDRLNTLPLSAFE